MKDKVAFVELLNGNNGILNCKLTDSAGNMSNYSNVPFQYELNEVNRKVTFTSNTDKGILKKVYTLSDDYQVHMETQLNGFENLIGYEFDYGSGIADTEEYLKMKRE